MWATHDLTLQLQPMSKEYLEDTQCLRPGTVITTCPCTSPCPCGQWHRGDGGNAENELLGCLYNFFPHRKQLMLEQPAADMVLAVWEELQPGFWQQADTFCGT